MLGKTRQWSAAVLYSWSSFDFVGESFAIIAQSGFCRCVRQGRIIKRKGALDGRNVDDDSRTLFQHLGEKCSIQTNRRKQIRIECLLPVIIIQRKRSAA